MDSSLGESARMTGVNRKKTNHGRCFGKRLEVWSCFFSYLSNGQQNPWLWHSTLRWWRDLYKGWWWSHKMTGKYHQSIHSNQPGLFSAFWSRGKIFKKPYHFLHRKRSLQQNYLYKFYPFIKNIVNEVVFLVSVEKKTFQKPLPFLRKTREFFSFFLWKHPLVWAWRKWDHFTVLDPPKPVTAADVSGTVYGGSRMDEESGEDGCSSFIGKKWIFNKSHRD